MNPNANEEPDIAAIENLRTKAGPCPRDVILMIRHEAVFYSRIYSTWDNVDMQKIIRLIRNPFQVSSNHFHAILLVRRVGEIPENLFDDDEAFVTLKTDWILDHVIDSYSKLELDRAKQLLNSSRGIGFSGAAFAGNLFEVLAIRYTSSPGEALDQNVFRMFAPMTRTKTRRGEFPVCYSYERGRTVSVSDCAGKDIRSFHQLAPIPIHALVTTEPHRV